MKAIYRNETDCYSCDEIWGGPGEYCAECRKGERVTILQFSADGKRATIADQRGQLDCVKVTTLTLVDEERAETADKA